jgi:hypothetical protein
MINAIDSFYSAFYLVVIYATLFALLLISRQAPFCKTFLGIIIKKKILLFLLLHSFCSFRIFHFIG